MGAGTRTLGVNFRASKPENDHEWQRLWPILTSGEWIWLSRWKGTSPSAMFEASDFPNLQSIQTRWDALEEETRQFIDQLDASQLAEVVSYINTIGEKWAYPLWQQMVHQVNHATQHRSEVAAILTHFGHSPGNLDYLVYQDEFTAASSS